jgi:hypothetical protein
MNLIPHQTDTVTSPYARQYVSHSGYEYEHDFAPALMCISRQKVNPANTGLGDKSSECILSDCSEI